MPKKLRKRKQPAATATRKILRGDGTWPFQAEIDRDDIAVNDIVITCFGGWGDGNIDDPQDSGSTASHRNTKTERIEGVAIPMDSAQFPAWKIPIRRDTTHFLAVHCQKFRGAQRFK
jgi:hypothetical protein